MTEPEPEQPYSRIAETPPSCPVCGRSVQWAAAVRVGEPTAGLVCLDVVDYPEGAWVVRDSSVGPLAAPRGLDPDADATMKSYSEHACWVDFGRQVPDPIAVAPEPEPVTETAPRTPPASSSHAPPELA